MLAQCSLMLLREIDNPEDLIENVKDVATGRNDSKQMDNKSKGSKRMNRALSVSLCINSSNEEKIDSFSQTKLASTAIICSARILNTHATQLPIAEKLK